MKLTFGVAAMKNNFGRYLRYALTKGEVNIEKKWPSSGETDLHVSGDAGRNEAGKSLRE